MSSHPQIPSPLLTKPTPLSPRRVLVLCGGWSAEREVSLVSGQGVAESLTRLGHGVEILDAPRDLAHLVHAVRHAFDAKGPEIIFNILHGRDGEDGVIQGVLNLLDIPYTFSGVLGSALAMNKSFSRAIVQHYGILCAEGEILRWDAYKAQPFSFFPHVLKPLGEGSSFGVHFVETPAAQDALVDQLKQTWCYGDSVLVERYIPGREIQVAVINDTAVGAVELCFEGPIFSYTAKYVEGHAQHLIPAPLSPTAYARVLGIAEDAHRILGCKNISRSDFRYDATQGADGTFYFLETNTQPGFTPISLVPDIAKKTLGWSYDDVVTQVLSQAKCPQ